MSPERTKIALTGGSGGIGALVAQMLRPDKADILIVGRSVPPTPGTRHLEGDLSNVEGISAVATELAAWSPDILINLAGAQYFGPFEHQADDHVAMSYMVNLVAPVRLAQAVLPAMKQRRTGHIVNIGSIFGSINYPHFVTYSSAKAGLRGFSQALRRELDGTGIDVTYIAPRAVKAGLNSGNVARFVEMAKMNADDPSYVARRIVRAIRGRRKDVFVGFPERLFVSLNALAPSLVDSAIARQTIEVRKLFNR